MIEFVYVLIMTLNYGDAVAMEKVETASRQECVAVGNAWYNNLHFSARSSFVCVKIRKVR